MDENPKKKKNPSPDELLVDYFKSVKLSGLVLEGAVFSDKFALEDNPDKMLQTEGFNLKISF